MLRFNYFALLAVAVAGCGTSAPPPPAAPPVAASGSTGSAPAEAAPGAAAPAVAPAAPVAQPPASPPPPTAGNPLRELAARHLEATGEGGWRPNEQAATELEKLDAAAVAGLVPMLADAQVEVRRGAAYFLLGQFNPNDREHVAAFSQLPADADPTVRGFGLAAINQMHAADQVAAAPQLAALLAPSREAKPENRVAIARLLGSLKSQVAAVAGRLALVAKDDPDPRVRSACYVALVQVAPPGEAIGPLAVGLADEQASVRLVAVVRLRQLGAAAAPAAKALAAALADSDPRVSNAAGESLVNIGQDAVPVIAEQLSSKSAAPASWPSLAWPKSVPLRSLPCPPLRNACKTPTRK